MRLSTLGVKLGYGIEQSAGTKPGTFTELGLVESIGGINLDVEQIDVSCLTDTITQYVKGRQDTGGTWDISFIADPDNSITPLETMFTSVATAAAQGKSTWYEVLVPNMSKAFFIVADCGDTIPLPEIGQNEALIIPLSLIIKQYKGLDTKVDMSGGGGSST